MQCWEIATYNQSEDPSSSNCFVYIKMLATGITKHLFDLSIYSINEYVDINNKS